MMKKVVLAFSIMVLVGCAANQAVQKKEISGAPPLTVAKDVQAPIAKAAPPNGGQGPAWSPDGSMVAFLSSTLHTPTDLWVMNADGSDARRLTTRGVQQFAWSRDGKSLMFMARRKGFTEILSIGADGSGEQRMPWLPPNAGIPEYSPDGSLFAFTAPDKEKTRNLWIGTADGKRIEAVTDKINIRSFFWHDDSRRIYYEAGKSYGVGIWEINLSTIASRVLVNKYVGSPVFSRVAGLIAYPFPTDPGQFDVQTVKLDGSDIRSVKAPRLAERYLAWDAEGKGVYYIGQDLEKVSAEEQAKMKAAAADDPGSHKKTEPAEYRRAGASSLWRLDLASGAELRVSPASLHVQGFALSPDRKKAVLAAVQENSVSAELFSLDLATGLLTPLASSRASAWMPIPAPDATRIAFFTNEGGIDTLKVASFSGEELASYPGMQQQGDSRLLWLPESDGLLLYTGKGLFAFTPKGGIDFPNSKDFRAYLSADASIQRDEVLISALPAFGEEAGLYKLKVVGDKFEVVDLRFPSAAEAAPIGYRQPKWAGDGSKLAFSDGVDIWTMQGDNTGRKQLTAFATANLAKTGKIAIASFPVWSVRGDRLCFSLSVYDGKDVFRQIWLMQADGSDQKLLHEEKLDSQYQVFLPEYTTQPFFTAGDEQVVFTAIFNGIPNLVAVEMKGGAVHQLTTSGASQPAFLPEEGVIVYTSLAGNNESIWVMNSDGTGQRPFVVKQKAQGKVAPPPAAAEQVKIVVKPAEPVKEMTTSVKEATLLEKKPAKKKSLKKKSVKKKPAKK